MVRTGGRLVPVNEKVDLMGTVGARLRAERSVMGLNQSDFAALSGQSKKTQMRYESDERAPDSNYLIAIAQAGADISYILTGERRPERPVAQLSVDGEDYAHIPLHSGLLAAGAGAENPGDGVIDHIAFRQDWLQMIGVTASSAALARVTGDSMQPTLWPGDLLLIDTARTEPLQLRREKRDRRRSAIYAVIDQGEARVKRIDHPEPDTMILISDNPDFAPEFRKGSDLSSLSIVGKVVWWGHIAKE